MFKTEHGEQEAKKYKMRLERWAQARSQGLASCGKEFGSWM